MFYFINKQCYSLINDTVVMRTCQALGREDVIG